MEVIGKVACQPACRPGLITTMLMSWRALSQGARDRALGIIFILLVAIIWVLASFLVQEVEAEGLSPFLLTYIANSLFVIYLPIYYVTRQVQRHRKAHARCGALLAEPFTVHMRVSQT